MSQEHVVSTTTRMIVMFKYEDQELLTAFATLRKITADSDMFLYLLVRKCSVCIGHFYRSTEACKFHIYRQQSEFTSSPNLSMGWQAFFLSQGSENSPWENQCICLWLGLLTCLFSWTSEWIIIPLWFEDFRSPPECLILWVDHHSTKVISLHSECWEGLAFSIPFHVIPFHVIPFHAIPFHLCICLKCSKCWNSNVPCYYVCHVQ